MNYPPPTRENTYPYLIAQPLGQVFVARNHFRRTALSADEKKTVGAWKANAVKDAVRRVNAEYELGLSGQEVEFAAKQGGRASPQRAFAKPAKERVWSKGNVRRCLQLSIVRPQLQRLLIQKRRQVAGQEFHQILQRKPRGCLRRLVRKLL